MPAHHKSLIAAWVGLAVVSAAPSQAFTMMGPGSTSCGQFAQAYAKSPIDTEQFFFSWAQGHMSGLNRAQNDRAHMMDLATKPIAQEQQEIRAYCNAHPLAEYYEAVEALYSTLSPPKN